MVFDWGDLLTAIIAVILSVYSSYRFAIKLREKERQSTRINAIYSVYKEIKDELNLQIEEYWSKGNEDSQELNSFSEAERKVIESRIIVSTRQLFKIGSTLEKYCINNKNPEIINKSLRNVHAYATGGNFQSKIRKSNASIVKKCRSTLNEINIDFISIF